MSNPYDRAQPRVKALKTRLRAAGLSLKYISVRANVLGGINIFVNGPGGDVLESTGKRTPGGDDIVAVTRAPATAPTRAAVAAVLSEAREVTGCSRDLYIDPV